VRGGGRGEGGGGEHGMHSVFAVAPVRDSWLPFLVKLVLSLSCPFSLALSRALFLSESSV